MLVLSKAPYRPPTLLPHLLLRIQIGLTEMKIATMVLPGGMIIRQTARGAAEVNQEAVTTVVLEALANPEVIRRLLTVVSPDGPAVSASSRTTSSSSGKFISIMAAIQ
jgi:hypothetical protein